MCLIKGKVGEKNRNERLTKSSWFNNGFYNSLMFQYKRRKKVKLYHKDPITMKQHFETWIRVEIIELCSHIVGGSKRQDIFKLNSNLKSKILFVIPCNSHQSSNILLHVQEMIWPVLNQCHLKPQSLNKLYLSTEMTQPW